MDDTDTLELRDPLTSTPVKEGSSSELHMISSGAIKSLSASFQSLSDISQSMSSLDSDTLASPNLSTMDVTPPQHPVTESTGMSQSSTNQNDDENQQHTGNESLNKPGYKVVIDNIDKDVKPHDMRLDFQTKSLHYVQIYSVKDRIDFSALSGLPADGEHCLYDILPSIEDYEKLRGNFAILVARSITDNLSFFTDDFMNLVTKHIPHPYSSEMSTKSEIVSSCVFVVTHFINYIIIGTSWCSSKE